MTNATPTSLLLSPSSMAPTQSSNSEKGGGLTGNVLGGIISGVILLVLFVAVGFIIFHFRHIAGKVIREYKARHPERFGVQPVAQPRRWGFGRKGKDGKVKAAERGEAVSKEEMRSGDVMGKVVKKEGRDEHVFIPLRDEAFGASYGQDEKVAV